MKKTFLMLFASFSFASAWAQDTSATVSDPSDFVSGGIVYTILNEQDKTCQTKAGSSSIINRQMVVSYGNSVSGKITIPATVTKDSEDNVYTVVGIGSYGFDKASEVIIEPGISYIAETAFSLNTSLKKIELPATLTSIGRYAFSNCSNLSEINLPAGLASIEPRTFYNCSSLQSVDIPETVTTIGEYAFSGCSVLNNVTLPASLQQLGAYAFSGCKALLSISFPETLNAIPANAFSSCTSLQNLVLPANINSIGANAFAGATALTSVICESLNIPAISSNSFTGNTLSSGTLYVYKNAMSAYQNSPYWSQFKTIQAIQVPVQSITLDKNNLSLMAGLSGYIKATLNPLEASADIIWSSSSDVVSVDQTGKVVAQKIGTATVTASAGDNVSAECVVTVTSNSYAHIVIGAISEDLYPGSEVTLSATITPSTITPDITWASSNESVATVDATTGVLTALAPGGAVITAQCAGLTGRLSIVVNPILAESIAMNKTTLALNVGDSETLSATLSPENVSYPEITWETSDPSVAIVANGNVTALAPGSCNIRAMCGEAIANCAVTVSAVMPTSVSLNVNSLSMQENETAQLIATVAPDNVTDTSITWTSSDDTIATVTTTGLITALKEGSATITAQCGDVNATCEVTVKNLTGTLSLNYTLLSMHVGDSQLLYVLDDIDTSAMSWSVAESNPASGVVEVSADGVVTAMGLGSATVKISGKAGNVTYTGTCNVLVEATPVESLTLDTQAITIALNSTAQLTATVNPENATDKTVTWQSDNDDVVTVSESGLLTAKGIGSAVVTASAGGASAACVVTVNNPAKSVSLNQTSINITIGSVYDLIAATDPADTTDTPEWTSSDTSVASVSDHGIVMGLSEGSATITVTYGAAAASCEVNVDLSTSVEDLEISEAGYEVISIAGFKVMSAKDKSQLKQLPSGIYIVNGKKVVIE